MREHLSEEACLLCLEAYAAGNMRRQAIQRLPKGALAPRANDGRRVCWDCQAAETLHRMGGHPMWGACRTVIESDRLEQYRMPGLPSGMVKYGIMKPSAPGNFEDQLRWLSENTQGECVDDVLDEALRVVEEGNDSKPSEH